VDDKWAGTGVDGDETVDIMCCENGQTSNKKKKVEKINFAKNDLAK
jgi:hypothetical protein